MAILRASAVSFGEPAVMPGSSRMRRRLPVARVVQVPARIAQRRRAFAHQPMRGRAAAGLQADVAAGEFLHDVRHHALRVADAVGRGDGAAIARRQRLLRARIDHHVVEVGLQARILVQGLQSVVRVQAHHAAEIAIGSAAGIAGHQQAAVGARRQQVQPLHRLQAQHFAQGSVRAQAVQRIVIAFETRQRDDAALRIQGDVVDPVRVLAQHGALAARVQAHHAPAFALAGGNTFAQQHRGRLRGIELDHAPPFAAAQRHAHAVAAVAADDGQHARGAQEQPVAIARPHHLFGLGAADQQARIAAAGRQQPQRARILLLAQVGHRITGRRKLGGHQRAVLHEGAARQARRARQRLLRGFDRAQAAHVLRR